MYNFTENYILLFSIQFPFDLFACANIFQCIIMPQFPITIFDSGNTILKSQINKFFA